MSSLLILRKVMEAANVAGVEHLRTQGKMTQEMGDAIRSKASRDVDGSIAITAIHAHRATNFVLGVPLGDEGLVCLARTANAR